MKKAAEESAAFYAHGRGVGEKGILSLDCTC